MRTDESKLIEEKLIEINIILRGLTEAPALVTPSNTRFLIDCGTVTGIFFNEGKQCLQYCNSTGVYEVHSCYPSEAWQGEGSLPLTPCKYEELKPGEYFAFSPTPRSQDYLALRLLGDKYAQVDDMDVDCYGGDDIDNEVWKVGK